MKLSGEEANKERGKKDWPETGDLLTFGGVPKYYYMMSETMKSWAADNLILGNAYKVSKCEVYSSWCAIWLEGISEEVYFNLNFFEW